MKPDKKGLYIVWSPNGEAPPKVAHESHNAACHAAWMMAKQYPGQTFYIMRRAGKPALESGASIDVDAADQVLA